MHFVLHLYTIGIRLPFALKIDFAIFMWILAFRMFQKRIEYEKSSSECGEQVLFIKIGGIE